MESNLWPSDWVVIAVTTSLPPLPIWIKDFLPIDKLTLAWSRDDVRLKKSRWRFSGPIRKKFGVDSGKSSIPARARCRLSGHSSEETEQTFFSDEASFFWQSESLTIRWKSILSKLLFWRHHLVWYRAGCDKVSCWLDHKSVSDTEPSLFPDKKRFCLRPSIGQRPRNYLSCCCCSSSSSCSPFGSFPLKNKFKWKKIIPSWESNRGPLAPQTSTLST